MMVLPRALKTVLLVLTAALVLGDFWRAEVVEVVELELAVSDPQRAAAFYRGVLDFQAIAVDDDGARLQLGEERLRLRRDAEVVRPRASNDRAFQHIAIVVTDMDAAFARLQRAGVELISAGPQRLPDWNRDAAGIRAVYFRDPDGNALELIAFPPDKGEPRWQRRAALFAGIDHTAIVVERTGPALAFYRDVVGLTVAGDSVNHGAEQAALSGVDGARVRITALRGARGPGVELLEYERPGTTTAPDGPRAWTIHLAAGGDNAFCRSGARMDRDGHALACSGRRAAWYVYAAEALRQHWPRYLMEGAQLGLFMIVALYLTILLEHTGSPLRRALPSAVLRRAIMGAGIGITVVLLLYSDWAMQSGGHFNTAVTLSFLAADRMQPWDAFFYLPAQLLGGWLGVWLAALPMRRASRHPKVSFVVTEPGPAGERPALIAEAIISFWMLLSLRLVHGSELLRPYLPWFAGLNLMLFITVEAPYSGMSLNPARTVASALPARSWRGLWLYLVAPIWAMHAAMWISESART